MCALAKYELSILAYISRNFIFPAIINNEDGGIVMFYGVAYILKQIPLFPVFVCGYLNNSLRFWSVSCQLSFMTQSVWFFNLNCSSGIVRIYKN